MGHPMTTKRVMNSQLELALTGEPVSTETPYDVAFMHRSLCVAGLPTRRPPHSPGTTAEFRRQGQGFNLKLITPNFDIPNRNISIPVGVPYGAKARLLILWMATQAKERQHDSSRFIEIPHIKEWLNAIGIGTAGDAINQTKEQLIKLCHTTFHASLIADYEGEETVFFRNDLFVEAGALAVEDLLHFRDGHLDKIRWPTGIVLTPTAWKRFNRDVVPVPVNRLRQVAHSATAIDVFLYLSYRLPLIPKGSVEQVSWRTLSAQFGNKAQPPSKFRENLGAAISAALRAYPEAKIDETPEGLTLHHSDPAVLRKAYTAVAGLDLIGQKPVRKRYVPLQEDDM